MSIEFPGFYEGRVIIPEKLNEESLRIFCTSKISYYNIIASLGINGSRISMFLRINVQ